MKTRKTTKGLEIILDEITIKDENGNDKIITFPNLETSPRGCLQSNNIKQTDPEFYDYINNLYPEDFPWVTKLYMFKNNMKEPPKCPFCGEYVRFRSWEKGFNKYCGHGCSNKDPEVTEKKNQTCLKNYGVPWSLSNKEVRKKGEQTKLELHGDPHFVNSKQAKQTNLKRRGVPWPMMDKNVLQKSKETCNKKYGGNSCMCDVEIRKKAEQTKLELHGDPHYNNREQAEQTCLNVYGVKNVSQIEGHAEKIRQTNIENHGIPNYVNHELGLKTRRENYMKKHPEILGWTEDDKRIYACPHSWCNKCEEKCYEISTQMYWDRFKDGTEPCTKLLPPGSSVRFISKEEIEDRKIFEDLNLSHIDNSYEFIPNLQLDVYCPGIKLAIEENGPWCHSLDYEDEEMRKEPEYHLTKWIECYLKGIELISLWGDWGFEDKYKYGIIKAKSKLYPNDKEIQEELKEITKIYKAKWFPDLKEDEWPLDLGWPPFEIDLENIKMHVCLHIDPITDKTYICSDTGKITQNLVY